MGNEKNNTEVTRISKHLRRFLYIIVIQSITAALWLLLIPKEVANADFLGYSYRRLLLLIPLCLPVIIALFVNNKFNKNKHWQKWLKTQKNKSKFAAALVRIGFLIALIVWSVIFLSHFLDLFKDISKYERLLPLFICYQFMGIELIVFVITSLYPISNENREKHIFPWKSFLTALLIIGLFFLIIEISKWGYGNTSIVIVSLGVPILEGQIWYIIGILVLITLAALALNSIPGEQRPQLGKQRDTAVFLLLWFIAVILWSSLPLPDHNYFAPSVRPPNFEKYPFSDAEQYDLHSLYVLFGTVDNIVVSKPLYVSFLTVLHAFGGLDYARIVFLQTLVIALFPGILYLIGKELHSRLGGIAVALLAIFREINSIQASSIANVSNSKLLLSGMLAALLASLLVYVLILWFKSPNKKIGKYPFILGGIIGAFILTRIQAIVLIPFGLMLVLVRYFKNIKSILISGLHMVLAISLVLAPVLIRNHAITGVYWVDNPSSSERLYSYFIFEDDQKIEIPEADTQEEQLNRNISVILSAFSNQFSSIWQFIMDHFMRNEISSMLIMPVRIGNQIKFSDFLHNEQPFWVEIYTQYNALNFFVLIFNSILIALGFAFAYKHNPRAVLCIIGFHVLYSISSAVVRLAGWRFILPADWIIYVFYAFGMVEIINIFFKKILNNEIKSQASEWLAYSKEHNPKSFTIQSGVAFGLFLLLIGGFIPIREALVPAFVSEYPREDICIAFREAAKSSYNAQLSKDVSEYCLDEGTSARMGYGVYPRFFDVGEGYYDRPHDLRFGEQDFSRLVFRLIGKTNSSVFIRTDREDIEFPNGAVVYTLAQDMEKTEAGYILIAGDEPEIIISNILLNQE